MREKNSSVWSTAPQLQKREHRLSRDKGYVQEVQCYQLDIVELIYTQNVLSWNQAAAKGLNGEFKGLQLEELDGCEDTRKLLSL